VKKATELYKNASDMVNTYAMNTLGLCYKNDDGVTKDMKKVIELYERASDMGNAMYNLGICYDNGDGVTQDEKEQLNYINANLI